MFRTGNLCVVIAMLSLAASRQLHADDNTNELLQQAEKLANQGQSADAVNVLNPLILQKPKLAAAYYLRGRERFRLADVEGSVADFEKLVALAPEREKSLWELGISYYYARQFEKGARQFELYQTYYDSDVENAVWRYLCMVPSTGLEQAREKLLPIANDPRVPLMEIYAMYRVRATPEDVFSAARRGEPPPEALKQRLFYAHLYVGLFHEAAGRPEVAKTHLAKAAGEYRIEHYMGDVARVHMERAKANEGEKGREGERE